jgi:hypothetical protein
MNGATQNLALSMVLSYRPMAKKLAGREGFEPSIPDPKSGALPLGDRPPRTPTRAVQAPGHDIRSSTSESPLAPPFSNNLVVFRDYFLFDHLSSFVIDWMSDIFVGPVFAFLAGHRYEIPRGAAYNLEVSDHKTVIQRDGYVSPEFLFIHRKDPNLGNLHRDPLLTQASCISGS